MGMLRRELSPLRSVFTLRFARAPEGALRLVLAGVFIALGWPSPAAAYCRTRSCDPSRQICPRDLQGCDNVEEPVYWPDGEAEIWIDPKGSPLWDLSAEQAQTALQNAIAHWTGVTCPDGQPLALTVSMKGILSTAPSADDNVLSFLDENSPYPTSVVGMTLLGFAGAELQYANIDINSEHHELVLNPTSPDQVDLEAVLTHEFGHFLGLDHSDVPGATMQPEAMGFGSIDLRSLEADDVEGICAIYGQGLLPRDEPEPKSTGSSDGGCSVTLGAGRATASWPWLLLLAAILCSRAYRRASPMLRNQRTCPVLKRQLGPTRAR